MTAWGNNVAAWLFPGRVEPRVVPAGRAFPAAVKGLLPTASSPHLWQCRMRCVRARPAGCTRSWQPWRGRCGSPVASRLMQPGRWTRWVAPWTGSDQSSWLTASFCSVAPPQCLAVQLLLLRLLPLPAVHALPLQLPQTWSTAPCSPLPQARFEQEEERALFKAYQQAAAQVRRVVLGPLQGADMWRHGGAAVAAAKRQLARRRTTGTDALTPSVPPLHPSSLCPSNRPVLPPCATGMKELAFTAPSSPCPSNHPVLPPCATGMKALTFTAPVFPLPLQPPRPAPCSCFTDRPRHERARLPGRHRAADCAAGRLLRQGVCHVRGRGELRGLCGFFFAVLRGQCQGQMRRLAVDTASRAGCRAARLSCLLHQRALLLQPVPTPCHKSVACIIPPPILRFAGCAPEPAGAAARPGYPAVRHSGPGRAARLLSSCTAGYNVALLAWRSSWPLHCYAAVALGGLPCCAAVSKLLSRLQFAAAPP